MHSRARRFAFFGPPGAGKSTAKRYLAERHNVPALAFADALRLELAETVRDAVGCPPPHDPGLWRDAWVVRMLDPATKAPWVPLLQAYGAFRRTQDPWYWVRALADTIGQIDCSDLLIDDARYDNEREFLVGNDFRLVFIDGPARTTKPEHESERDWRRWERDVVVPNRGTVEQFRRRLDRLWERGC